MCVFVRGVGTEAAKGGGEGSACSSPVRLPAKGRKVQEESRWEIRERKNNSGGSTAFAVSPGNSAEQLQSHDHSLTFSGVAASA